MPGLETLMLESRITLEMANLIVASRRVPLELAKYLGLLAHTSSPATNPQCLSPLTLNSNGHGVYRSTSGGLTGTIGSASPNLFGGGGGSPMHHITKGISGLTTGGGSISKGTSLASSENHHPLDLTMDVHHFDGAENEVGNSLWYVQPNLYDISPLNLSLSQPSSPSLCIIQEEHSNMAPMSATVVLNDPVRHLSLETTPTNETLSTHVQNPQIFLTDVQGSEITLVGSLSDSSSRAGDSDDSLDISRPTKLMNLQGLVITEPTKDMPSITRGVGRKASLENQVDHLGSSSTANTSAAIKLETANYARRGSDKSLGFSDDSLSNDSNNLSPSQEPSQSSGFKSCDSHSEVGEALRLSPDSLAENKVPPDMCYELPLPEGCFNLDSTRILQYVKNAIDLKVPPKGFTVMSSAMELSEGPSVEVNHDVEVGPRRTSGCGDNLNLEYSGGLHIELQVCEGRANETGTSGHEDSGGTSASNKGIIKLRRISGDHFEYGKLCQQLISSLRV